MKNIEINIKQSDGTYEVLYPKVNAVSSNISTEVSQQFGLENGSIDDVLKYLGKFNEYWYYKQGFDTLSIKLEPEIHSGWLYCNNGITYGKNITYNNNGDAYLVNPTVVGFVNSTANQTYVDEQMAIFLNNLPCYILAWTTTSNVTVDDLKVFYVPEGATYSFEQDNIKTFFCDHSGTNIWNIVVSGDSQASVKPCDLKVKNLEFPIEYYQSTENNLPSDFIEYYGTIYGDYSSNVIGNRYNNINYSNEIEIINGKVKLKEPISTYNVYNNVGNITYKFIDDQYSSKRGIYYCQRQIKRGGNSSDYAITANVIPVSIYSKGYKYLKLGKPFEKLPMCAQYFIGSYVGTGLYGANNPTVLKFKFIPKLIICNTLYWSTNGWQSSYIWTINNGIATRAAGSNGDVSVTLNDTEISFVSTDDAFAQFNYSGSTYNYVAFG